MNIVLIVSLVVIFMFLGCVVVAWYAEMHGYRKGYTHGKECRKPYFEPYESDDC